MDSSVRPIIAASKIKTSGLLKIGEFAQLSGETVPTIRFWTSHGLLAVKAYSQGGYQLYDPSLAVRARQIRKLQQAKKLTIGSPKLRLAPKAAVIGKIKDSGFLTIGTVAKRTGETISTIRFWTDEGLLPVKAFSKGGYQLYEPAVIQQAKRIRKLEEKKRMTIGEIGQLAKLGKLA